MSVPSISLRQAVTTDADALSRFAASVFPLGGRPNADPADLEAFIANELTPAKFHEFIVDTNSSLIVAEEGQQIAGFVLVVRHCRHPQISAQNPAELRKLYVDPQHHGKGVADALMRRALEWVQPPADIVWLSVFSGNPRAIAFYRRWGFRMAGSQKFLVGTDPQEDFLMRRDLQAAEEGTRCN